MYLTVAVSLNFWEKNLPNWTNNKREGNFLQIEGFCQAVFIFPGLSFIFKYFPGLEIVIAKIKYISGFPGRVTALLITAVLKISKTNNGFRFHLTKFIEDIPSYTESQLIVFSIFE